MRKSSFLHHFIQIEYLPRQAPDKHKEKLEKNDVFYRGRRVYLFSDNEGGSGGSGDPDTQGSAPDPSRPRLVPSPEHFNRWRNNLVLNRNYWGVRDGNGNCLRCDDGASWFNMSENVCYASSSGMEFNGGSQVYTHGKTTAIATCSPVTTIRIVHHSEFTLSCCCCYCW